MLTPKITHKITDKSRRASLGMLGLFGSPGFWGAMGATSLLGLAGCSSTLKYSGKPSRPENDADNAHRHAFSLSREQGEAAAARAYALIGTPYRYGGDTAQGGFDCSGFISHVYAWSARIRTPRTVRSIQLWSIAISQAEVRAGDLVFFGSGSVATHAGICAGHERFVHSPSTGGRVREEGFASGHWRQQLIGFGRP